MRSRIVVALLAVLSLLPVALIGSGVANAEPSRPDFVRQAQSAGLSAAQAQGLQAKIDDYLVRLGGRGTQVSPNQIDLKGGMLNVTVPGEAQPRNLVRNPAYPAADANCRPSADYEWFCAYQYEWRQGDVVDMWDCWVEFIIPWSTFGSWENNQTRGTQPRLTFIGGAIWDMPGAYSNQLSGVGWSPVFSIVPCRH